MLKLKPLSYYSIRGHGYLISKNVIAPLTIFVVIFHDMGKNKATVLFRQLSSGEVIGEIIDEEGVVVESKNFGVTSEEEFGIPYLFL